jgi:DNA polymerase III epsilon subunit-like protein
LTDADLAGAPAIQEVWPAILQALSGCYLISFNNEWDIKTLKAAAEKHGLPVPVMIGECLQRRSTQYYLKEYYLDLPVVSKRMGHKMASYDALDRLKAQAAVVAGMAQGIVDVSEPEEQIAAPAATESSTGEIISSSDDDGLGDLSDHPF